MYSVHNTQKHKQPSSVNGMNDDGLEMEVEDWEKKCSVQDWLKKLITQLFQDGVSNTHDQKTLE